MSTYNKTLAKKKWFGLCASILPSSAARLSQCAPDEDGRETCRISAEKEKSQLLYAVSGIILMHDRANG